VLTGQDRNIVIDTGFRRPECLESLTQGLTELGVDMNKTDILLTHMHSDHSGLCVDIASPDSRIYIAKGEMHWMMREERKAIRYRDESAFLRLGFTQEQMAFHVKNVSGDLTSDDAFGGYFPIEDGDTFECAGYSLRAIETPGHTPAHMCFWLERERIMFTGDHVLFDISPNITIWRELHDTLGSYMESLRAIDKYDVALALPGHRESGDFHARIAKLLAHHEKRLSECYEIIRDNPGLSAYDITGLMKWKIRAESWEDFPLGQKWFAVGEAFSHIRHLQVLGKVRVDTSEEIIRMYAE
jgi:glyoxylase-like metal-dependent hydrolase (beta-lactamase superfamily II)